MEFDRIKTGTDVDLAFAAPDEPRIALWLKCYWLPTPWHLGIAFRRRGETEVTRIDQIEEGLRVGTGVEEGERWWVFLPVDARSRARINVASSRLKRIAARGARVPLPYDHLYLGGSFDARGTYVPAEGERGLNCASVVLAIFEGAAWPLVDRSSWTGRLLEPVVASAIETELPDAQRAAFQANQGLVILPTEVAGACLFPLPRVSFSEARRGAEHFEAQERARTPAPS